MSLSNRERGLAVAAGLIAAGFIIYLLAVRWFLPRWASINSDIHDADIALELKPDKERKAAQLEQAYAERVSRAMPFETPEEAERLFSNQLFALARKAGMPTPSVSRRSAHVAKDERDVTVINFSFTVRCPIKPLTQFLSDFYAEPQAQRIESLTISPSGRYESTEEGTLQAQMVISAVVIPPETEKKTDQDAKTGAADS